MLRIHLVMLFLLFALGGCSAKSGGKDVGKMKAAQGDAAAQVEPSRTYEKGEGVLRDAAPKAEPASLQELREHAAQGDAKAQSKLGYIYSIGKGVSHDDTEAAKWYRLAAVQGDAEAQSNLGAMYEAGSGVPRDSAEAVKWYRLAAAQGRASAQASLGHAYYYGEGVPRDYVEALKWFRLAAARGDTLAQSSLMVMYERGDGVSQDFVQAHKWCKLAASDLSGVMRDLAAKRCEVIAARITPEGRDDSRAGVTTARRLKDGVEVKTETEKGIETTTVRRITPDNLKELCEQGAIPAQFCP